MNKNRVKSPRGEILSVEIKLNERLIDSEKALSSRVKMLESNLTKEIELKNSLLRDRDNLSSRLEQLKEDLSSKEQKYKDKIDELKSTISQILLTSKEKTKEAFNEYNRSIHKFIDRQNILEPELTSKIEERATIL